MIRIRLLAAFPFLLFCATPMATKATCPPESMCTPNFMQPESVLPLLSFSIPTSGCSQVAMACDCPADLNDDGTVDAIDLSVLLAAWGSSDCKPVSCNFNGGASIGCYDLEYLLGNQGPCPVFGDIDGSGETDCEDLLTIEAAAQEHRDCRADINRNGVLDIGDADALICLSVSDPAQDLGDLDGSGGVDGADLAIVLQALASNPTLDCRPDLNRDGCVTWSDREPLLPPPPLSGGSTAFSDPCMSDCVPLETGRKGVNGGLS